MYGLPGKVCLMAMTDGRTTYNLVRRVYCAALQQRHQDYIKAVITTARDPELFRLVRQLTAKRTLPAMDAGDGLSLLTMIAFLIS